MKHSLQMSETLRLGIILALSGGFMDAYSYLERGNVFANAQTGNLLLFGVNLAEGNYFPHSLNPLANSLTSFACGIQVESFRKIRNRGAATTMCIGNLRNGTENLHRFLRTHDRKAFYNALLFYGIILCFIIGAVLGNFVIKRFHEKSILVCSALLFIAFFMMFVNKEQK